MCDFTYNHLSRWANDIQLHQWLVAYTSAVGSVSYHGHRFWRSCTKLADIAKPHLESPFEWYSFHITGRPTCNILCRIWKIKTGRLGKQRCVLYGSDYHDGLRGREYGGTRKRVRRLCPNPHRECWWSCPRSAFVQDSIVQSYSQSVTLTIEDIHTEKVTYRLLAMALRNMGQFLTANNYNVLDFWIVPNGGENPDYSTVLTGSIRQYRRGDPWSIVNTKTIENWFLQSWNDGIAASLDCIHLKARLSYEDVTVNSVTTSGRALEHAEKSRLNLACTSLHSNLANDDACQCFAADQAHARMQIHSYVLRKPDFQASKDCSSVSANDGWHTDRDCDIDCRRLLLLESRHHDTDYEMIGTMLIQQQL